MVPTPLARSIAANVASSLGGLEQLLQRTGRFDPGTSPRSFTIAMREVNELPFLPMFVEQLAQPGERMAHCGLRQVQTLAGRRDTAVAVDRVENREQIQVDPGKLHWRAPLQDS
jgi:hypothetical protein